MTLQELSLCNQYCCLFTKVTLNKYGLATYVSDVWKYESKQKTFEHE